jgi:hypothetical protein
MLGCAAWGIATGVGLLRLREWARISQIVFAALLALTGLASIAVIAFIPMPVPPNDRNPELTQHVFQFVRIGISVFYGGLAALGAWWLFYFNKKSIREEFRGRVSLTIAAAPLSGPPSAMLPAPMSSARPASISVIAALLFIGAASLPLIILTGSPAMMMGFVFYGPTAALICLPWTALQATAAYGLLKMKMWGRTLAIVVVSFGVVNLFAMALIPGSQARFDQAMQRLYSQWGIPVLVPAVTHLPILLTVLPSLPILAVEIWFLVTRKPAFIEAAARQSAS